MQTKVKKKKTVNCYKGKLYNIYNIKNIDEKMYHKGRKYH